VLLLIAAGCGITYRRKWQRERHENELPIDNEPMSGDVQPNRSSLRLITDDELIVGRELGRGAFGVVYKVRVEYVLAFII
jgi:hypothetical protein